MWQRERNRLPENPSGFQVAWWRNHSMTICNQATRSKHCSRQHHSPHSTHYSELNLNQYIVGSPCHTICTVCGSSPSPDLNLIHYKTGYLKSQPLRSPTLSGSLLSVLHQRQSGNGKISNSANKPERSFCRKKIFIIGYKPQQDFNG